MVTWRGEVVSFVQGLCLHSQHLQEPAGSPKSHVVAVCLVLTLPEVQPAHESEGLLSEKSPNSGEDWLALRPGHSSNMVAGMKGEIEGEVFYLPHKIFYLALGPAGQTPGVLHVGPLDCYL